MTAHIFITFFFFLSLCLSDSKYTSMVFGRRQLVKVLLSITVRCFTHEKLSKSCSSVYVLSSAKKVVGYEQWDLFQMYYIVEKVTVVLVKSKKYTLVFFTGVHAAYLLVVNNPGDENTQEKGRSCFIKSFIQWQIYSSCPEQICPAHHLASGHNAHFSSSNIQTPSIYFDIKT